MRRTRKTLTTRRVTELHNIRYVSPDDTTSSYHVSSMYLFRPNMFAGLRQSFSQGRLRVNGITVRAMSGKSTDGAVKDEGGSFGKKGEADENAYFHKLGREQLGKIKKEENNEKKEDNLKK